MWRVILGMRKKKMGTPKKAAIIALNHLLNILFRFGSSRWFLVQTRYTFFFVVSSWAPELSSLFSFGMAHLGMDSKKGEHFKNKSVSSKTFIENEIHPHSI